eukprot:1688046-Heterocapsa_arctica.AAC.1
MILYEAATLRPRVKRKRAVALRVATTRRAPRGRLGINLRIIRDEGCNFTNDVVFCNAGMQPMTDMCHPPQDTRRRPRPAPAWRT